MSEVKGDSSKSTFDSRLSSVHSATMASFLPTLRSRALLTTRPTIRALSSTPRRSNSEPSSSTEATADSASSADTGAIDAAEAVAEAAATPQGKAGKGYRAWLSGEGARFRKGVVGRTNWIGDTVRSLPAAYKVSGRASRSAGAIGRPVETSSSICVHTTARSRRLLQAFVLHAERQLPALSEYLRVHTDLPSSRSPSPSTRHFLLFPLSPTRSKAKSTTPTSTTSSSRKRPTRRSSVPSVPSSASRWTAYERSFD